MEVDGGAQEGQEEGVAGVGVGDGEGWVGHQLLHILQVALQIGAGLHMTQPNPAQHSTYSEQQIPQSVRRSKMH